MDIIFYKLIDQIITDANISISINNLAKNSKVKIKDNTQKIFFSVKSTVITSLSKITIDDLKNNLITNFYKDVSNFLQKELIKSCNNLVFFISDNYHKISKLDLECNIENNHMVVLISTNKVEYNTYLDLIPQELRIIILSKMNAGDKITFNTILIENKEYTDGGNTLKIITGKDIKIHDSKKSILEHPYVIDIFNEILIYQQPDYVSGIKEQLKISSTPKYISIYSDINNTDHKKNKYVHIKINPISFDIHTYSGVKIVGNLNDEPWHGLDCIDDEGRATSHSANRIKKIKILEERLKK